MIVIVLLGSLAYGSYAFGKYVLSAHLLNESPVKGNAGEAVKRSTRAAEAVTRRTNYKGSQPKVELKVLPADDDGEGPAPPPRRSLVRHSEEESPATRAFESSSDAEAEKAVEQEAQRAERDLSAANRSARNDTSSSDSEPSPTSEPSRRSRNRRASRVEDNPFADLGTSSNLPNTNSPVSGGGVYRGGRDGLDGDEETPRRRRRKRKPRTENRTSSPDSGSMVPVPEVSAPRATRRATVITDSPVPRPETESESPVPQPE